MSKHFENYELCSRGIDSEGNEREYWSFHTFNANTLIGQTVGRLCNAFAGWMFHRRHPDLSPLVGSGTKTECSQSSQADAQ
ncbi:TPA: hypothetical protein NHR53_005966 [Pseudomonas aeruginosa]|uniref:hypothetical protein n=1 Tax=Pseudomonas aeruginosa TaxID=287 RepID=UPI00111213B0|nr:hypothetical protein [Pseudomonas aeruginosa]HCE7248056.1 hypothetical protein [Pseudomonas aeruginosa]HCE8129375.1 hypothetical protein [Pseudomonas aeruginosa]HCF0447466.1 hypothetical protein [Pseudomonas aeruginosa]